MDAANINELNSFPGAMCDSERILIDNYAIYLEQIDDIEHSREQMTTLTKELAVVHQRIETHKNTQEIMRQQSALNRHVIDSTASAGIQCEHYSDANIFDAHATDDFDAAIRVINNIIDVDTAFLKHLTQLYKDLLISHEKLCNDHCIFHEQHIHAIECIEHNSDINT
jgi:hypothetical protein